MAETILVAGIGNIFLRDDGFGPEVVRRLAARRRADPTVRIVDYGIRGMHLAYDVADGCAALVLVDTVPGGVAPGEITVLEIGPGDLGGGEFDAHGMSPVAVLANLDALGGTLPPTYLVGCRPADLGDGIGLTPAVEASVDEAVAVVGAVVDDLLSTGSVQTRVGG